MKNELRTESGIKKKNLEISLILRTAEKQSQTKDMKIGQQNIILKRLLLRLLKSGIKDLIQWKN